MKSESWKAAQARWCKEKTKMISVQLVYSKDQDIIDHLERFGSKQAYIKALIRNDIEERKRQPASDTPADSAEALDPAMR